MKNQPRLLILKKPYSLCKISGSSYGKAWYYFDNPPFLGKILIKTHSKWAYLKSLNDNGLRELNEAEEVLYADK